MEGVSACRNRTNVVHRNNSIFFVILGAARGAKEFDDTRDVQSREQLDHMSLVLKHAFSVGTAQFHLLLNPLLSSGWMLDRTHAPVRNNIFDQSDK